MTTNRLLPAILLVSLAGALVGLTGCASPATTKGMVINQMPSLNEHPYTVGVRTQGGSETGSGGVSDNDFAKAIEESIIASRLFAKVVQPQEADYTLNVTIISTSKPLFGADFTVIMEAAWTLINNSTKDVVMRDGIKSMHKATMGDSLVGASRFRLAVEGAARENIRLGLSAISNLRLE